MSGNKVWVFSEKYNLMLEMLSKGREIADKLQAELTAVLIGSNVQEKADQLIKCGADKAYLIDSPALEDFQAEAYLNILHNLTVNYKPSILLIGSTKDGKTIAARLATRLETGCIPDCTKLSVNDEGKLSGERITYGGNAIAKVTFRSKPQIATIPGRVFEKPEPQDHKGQVIELDVRIEDSKTEVVETRPLETSSTDIEEAEVIISCGRGLAKKEDKALLEELANILNGQVGNSRPLAEDRKWFTEWVGLSGHKVTPKLYIACGISGVIQHLAGIRDSKVIVAINSDPEALIFEAADYGVVGDLYQILPALTEAFKKHLQ
jgi:electron transfer flavoprotein alpha subunit